MKTLLSISQILLIFLLFQRPLTAESPCCAEMGASAYSPESIYQLDARFTDDKGKSFDLGSLRGRPVVITMFFSSCTYACPLILGDMTRIRNGLPSEQKSTAFVMVSFDSDRDQPEVLKAYRESRRIDEGWYLLHGDNDAVRELAALLGVKYQKQADGSYAHSNLITVLNRQGEITHQRTGLQGEVQETIRAVTVAAK